MTPYANPAFGSLFLQPMLDGKPLSKATGFTVNSSSGPMLITNKHVLTGTNVLTGANFGMPNALEIHHHKKGFKDERLVCLEPIVFDGAPLWHEHPGLDGNADFVALPLTKLDEVQLFPYDPKQRFFQEIPTTGTLEFLLEPTDSVSIIGYPYGKSSSRGLPIWVNGFMATEIDDCYMGLPVILVDSRTREGQSGSPVVAFRPAGAPIRVAGGGMAIDSGAFGTFVGVYSGRIDKESDIGIVWKASALAELIDSIEAK